LKWKRSPGAATSERVSLRAGGGSCCWLHLYAGAVKWRQEYDPIVAIEWTTAVCVSVRWPNCARLPQPQCYAHLMKHSVVVLIAGAAFAACKGGEGEDCKSHGLLGPSYCEGDLICNSADAYICERPMSKAENQSCNSDQLCMTGLWC